MKKDSLIDLIKFIETEILPKAKGLNVSDILLSGDHYFKVNI